MDIGEADRRQAYAEGELFPDNAWILSDRDVWYANPSYKGPPVPHPEEECDNQTAVLTAEDKTMQPQVRLRILASHCGAIALDPAPARFTCHPCEGVIASVEITPAREGFESPLWDNVTINGENCGNRFGGLRRFMELVHAVNPTIHPDND